MTLQSVPPMPAPILQQLEDVYFEKLRSATERFEHRTLTNLDGWRSGPLSRLFYESDWESALRAYCRQLARRYWRMALTYPNSADHPDRF